MIGYLLTLTIDLMIVAGLLFMLLVLHGLVTIWRYDRTHSDERRR